MKPSIIGALRIGLIVAACALLVTGVWGAPPTTGSNQTDSGISSVSAEDPQVSVTTAGPDLTARDATVTTGLKENGGSGTTIVPVSSLFGRQKIFVVPLLMVPVTGTSDVGMIVDDPSPF
jgi:hypothetical protein